ncbi:MAG: 30S ribosome-binding factor RbfA [Alphaproteobacteria bacterium]|nr:30S ribosome-binding factor RbfA [Alphaproteobacteria bacterium]
MASRHRTRRPGEGHGTPAGPSQRQLRVAETLRHALSAVLQRGDFRDPALEGESITVTEVRVSPDLKNATAFIMPLGGAAEKRALVKQALTRAQPFIRHQVGEKVTLRSLPKFTFLIDEAFDRADEIDRALKAPSVARDLDHDGPGDGSSDGEEER